MNYSDAERIASVFDLAGYVPAKTEAEADVAIVVACSVRQTAIDRIYGKVKPWDKRRRKTEFKTILAGCVLPEDKRKMAKSFDLVFDINEIQKLEEFILSLRGEDRRGNLDHHASLVMTERAGDYLSIIPKYESSFRAYVPIMTGCDNFCSYCAVPYTRGREKSRSVGDILGEIKGLVASGYKEITLLGQNVNSYGGGAPTGSLPGQGETLPKGGFIDLLKKIDGIPGDYRVYFYSNHPKDFSDELIEVLPKLKHFPKYIHLPLQSGSDDILRKMNRHYTQKDYLELVSKIREVMPNVMLTTDILVGFPGETDADFKETMMVVREARFEMIFIGQYSPRPGTVSAKLKDDVTGEIKKKREKVITDYLRNYLVDHNLKFVGQTVRVLIDEQKPVRTPDGGSTFFGRTEGYKVVEISLRHPEPIEGSGAKTDQPLVVGQFYDVKISEAKAWKLIATLS
jgi:tRNA-2-methylthio-N6-dimethylallyladenosine synthase